MYNSNYTLNSVSQSNVYEKLKTDPDANPNNNYEILSSAIIESKENHIPKKTQRFNKNIHKKRKMDVIRIT